MCYVMRMCVNFLTPKYARRYTKIDMISDIRHRSTDMVSVDDKFTYRHSYTFQQYIMSHLPTGLWTWKELQIAQTIIIGFKRRIKSTTYVICTHKEFG